MKTFLINFKSIKQGLYCAIYPTFTPYFKCWQYFDEYFMDKNLLHIYLTKFSKLSLICVNESLLKMMKNAFYFTFKALFVLKIFKLLA